MTFQPFQNYKPMILSSSEQQSELRNSQFYDRQQITPQQYSISCLKYWLLLLIIALVACSLLRYIIGVEYNVYRLEQNLATLQSKFFQRIQSLKTKEETIQKEPEVQRFLVKTQSQIQHCLSRLIDLKNSVKYNETNTNELLEPIPKIFWLYTQHKLQAQKMVQQFLGKHMMRVANQSGIQVRVTNSYDAYDWLSNRTTRKVTKTMQNMQIEQKVNELLKIALLMEHGGILVSPSQLFLTNKLDWVFEYFNRTTTTQVLLFSQNQNTGNSTKITYQDYFIAAVPRADLIVQIFNTLCDTITLKSIKYQELSNASFVNHSMNVTYIQDILKNTINGALNLIKAQLYAVEVIQLDLNQRLSSMCDKNIFLIMKQSKDLSLEVCGNNEYFINHLNRTRLQDEIEKALEPIDDSAKSLSPDNYWYQLLGLQQNLKYFLPMPPREVKFCVLDAWPGQNLTAIKISLENLKKQSYSNWVAVYFVAQITEEMNEFMAAENKEQRRVILAKASDSLGRNYELGIIKQCPNKSFIALLKRTDSFDSIEGLSLLAKSLQDHGVLGAFVSMNVSGALKQPQSTYPDYTKMNMNGKSPKYDDLEQILNFLKIFHSDCYKILPQFSHKSHEGEYYNDRFKFLEAFVQMVKNVTIPHDNTELPHTQRTKWFIKSNYELFDVPNSIKILKEVVINSLNWEKVDITQIAKNNFKHDVYPMTYNLDHLMQNGQTMADFAVYNSADQIQPYTKREKPDIIPKIFHLIWIQGEIPEVKRKVIELNRELYPDFQFKIWSKANVTRQLLPLSYDLLNNLYSVNKFTRYSKMATMADVMRHQILYYQGGVYMDTSMLLFNKAIYKWLSYKAFVGSQHTLRHRWSQNMCIFAAMPGYAGLQRIISHRNTNRYNIFLRDAMQIAGPVNFRHFIQGYQEYDKDILLIDFDGFYPITYDHDLQYQSYCLTKPSNLKYEAEVVFRLKDVVLIKNCGEYYPYSFGRELSMLGSSWQNPKW